MHILKPTRRKLAALTGSFAVLAAIALLAVGWFYSNEIRSGALAIDHDAPVYEVGVLTAENGQVTLRFPQGGDPADEPEAMGLEWPGGYARIGRTLSLDGLVATRAYTPLEGSLAAGQMVRLDKFAFPGDPMSAHGTAFDDVRFEAPLGDLAAWQVDGTADTWAVFVHGKASDQGEALRMLPVVTRAGLPSLVITYRNDEGAAQDPSAYYQYGVTEWADLDAAVRHALAQGAEDVVLIGYSMGGAIVMSFLLESPLADRVAGIILDAPMLDFGATIDLAAEDRGLPVFLTWVAKRVTGVRFGIDWEALDYLDEAGELSAPILLFHGSADETVPVSISETLAAERPGLVTYEGFEGAPHVGAWNVDPERYETAVAEFLQRVAR